MAARSRKPCAKAGTRPPCVGTTRSRANSDVIEVTRRGLRPQPNIRVLNRSKQSQQRLKRRSVLSVISCSKNACIVRNLIVCSAGGDHHTRPVELAARCRRASSSNSRMTNGTRGHQSLVGGKFRLQAIEFRLLRRRQADVMFLVNQCTPPRVLGVVPLDRTNWSCPDDETDPRVRPMMASNKGLACRYASVGTST